MTDLINFARLAMATIPGWTHTPRHDVIAEALALEAAALATPALPAERLIATGVVMSWRESNWFLRVHNGTLLGDGGRAYCLMQVHPNKVFAPHPQALLGADLRATRACFNAGLRALVYHHRRCSLGDNGMIAGYMTGHACEGYGSKRVAMIREVLRKTRELAAERAKKQ